MYKRQEQLAVLKTLHHSMMTDPVMPDLLEGAESDQSLVDWEQANVKEMRRSWVHAAAVEPDLVEALSKASSKCEAIWRQARQDADFKSVLPSLEEVLNLTRKEAHSKSEKLNVSAYDALLDQYEPDGRAAEINIIFSELKSFLPNFIDDVLTKQAAGPDTLPTVSYTHLTLPTIYSV